MELGLRGDDWYITPMELEALIERHRIRERNALVGSALICATLANINRDAAKKPEPFTVEDFLPGDRPQTSEEELAQRRLDEFRIAAAKAQAFGLKR